MEPLFSLEDERTFLPDELHTPAHNLESTAGGRRASRGGGGDDAATTMRSRHVIHVVTQYYMPKSLRRAREVSIIPSTLQQ